MMKLVIIMMKKAMLMTNTNQWALAKSASQLMAIHSAAPVSQRQKPMLMAPANRRIMFQGTTSRSSISRMPVIKNRMVDNRIMAVLCGGTAELISDQATKNHAWEAIDYDLTQFGSTGPEDPNFLPVRITPTRVELSEMFGSMNKRVWRA